MLGVILNCERKVMGNGCSIFGKVIILALRGLCGQCAGLNACAGSCAVIAPGLDQ